MSIHPTPPHDADPTEQTAPRDAPVTRHRTHLMPGRPHRLSLRLSDEEQQLVADAAVAVRLTPAGFAAKAAVAAAAHQIAPAAGLAETLRDLQRELFAARRAINMYGSNVNQAAAAYNSTNELPVWITDAVALCRAAVGRLDEVTGLIDRRLR
jgi:uncharacterized protein (DUF1778 family)